MDLAYDGSVGDKVPKWNFHKANWSSFSEHCQDSLLAIDIFQVDDHVVVFTDVII